ncbi:MAG: ribosome silencing factor [Bacteroidetes bacterium]|nr:ribosome silencing factor [Bacteroidota bacterium]
MESNELVNYITELILQKKGSDVLVLNLKKQTTVTDYFIICSASSDIQIKAIADNIIKETKKIGQKPWHNEGYNNLSWVLLDFIDVVVHIFLNNVRKFYNLEGLWGDAEITEIKDNLEIPKVK